MSILHFTLALSLILQASSLVHAFPSYTYNSNITSPPSVSTAAPGCVANCSVRAWGPEYVFWTSMTVTTTITAATVIYVVNNRTNTTRTVTSYNELPAGYTLPPTNSDGTVVATVTVPKVSAGQVSDSTTVLAYPTILTDWPDDYTLYGVIPTTSGTQSVCVTAGPNGSYIPLPSQPQGPAAKPASGDQYGLLWTTTREFGCLDVYITSFPQEAAFTACGPVRCLEHCKLPDADLDIARGRWTCSNLFEPGVCRCIRSANSISFDDTPDGFRHSIRTRKVICPNCLISARREFVASSSSANAANFIASLLGAAQSSNGASPSQLPTPQTSNSVAVAQVNSAPPPIPSSILTTTPAATIVPLVVGSSTYNAVVTSGNSQIAYIVQGQTLVPGSSVTVGSGSAATAVGLQTSNGVTHLIIGTSSSVLPVLVPAALATAPSLSNVVASPVVAVGGYVTLGTGSLATVVPLTTNSIGQNAIVVGGTTSVLSPATNLGPALPIFTVNSHTFIGGSSSEYVVGSQTLRLGGSVTIGSTVVALTTNSAGQSIVIAGGTTSTLSPAALSVPQALTIDGQTLSAISASAYVLSGQTLAPGHPITLGSGSSQTVISLATDSAGNSVVVMGSSTSALRFPTSAGALVLNGQTLTPASASEYIVAGQTLAPGHPITLGSGVSRTVVSLTTDAAGHSVVVVGSSTSTLPLPTSAGVGGYIYSGLGGSTGASATAAVTATATATATASQPSKGGASRALHPSERWCMSLALAFASCGVAVSFML
ncbi:hypothetical protein B0A49_07720 [Cryomyces minteri]|uniref:Uncharacterized protein n=1 Tax=Cryomyces minteri TaxID=331657 RepID=A0A4U0X1L6_9PEZI|nr:hypothetical protein B0A49_07720 [Cryomyces minteri]